MDDARALGVILAAADQTDDRYIHSDAAEYFASVRDWESFDALEYDSTIALMLALKKHAPPNVFKPWMRQSLKALAAHRTSGRGARVDVLEHILSTSEFEWSHEQVLEVLISFSDAYTLEEKIIAASRLPNVPFTEVVLRERLFPRNPEAVVAVLGYPRPVDPPEPRLLHRVRRAHPTDDDLRFLFSATPTNDAHYELLQTIVGVVTDRNLSPDVFYAFRRRGWDSPAVTRIFLEKTHTNRSHAELLHATGYRSKCSFYGDGDDDDDVHEGPSWTRPRMVVKSVGPRPYLPAVWSNDPAFRDFYLQGRALMHFMGTQRTLPDAHLARFLSRDGDHAIMRRVVEMMLDLSLL